MSQSPASNQLIVNILLADDDIDDCNFFKKALESISVPTQLKTVADGEKLMEYLDGPEQLPHVLFLDINMPRKNGFECLAEIKRNAKLKSLPVVMISTANSTDKMQMLFKKGANIYVRKANTLEDLVQIIRNALPIALDSPFSDTNLKYIFNA